MKHLRHLSALALLILLLPARPARAQEIKDDTIRVSSNVYPMLSFMGEVRDAKFLCDDYRPITSTTTIVIRPNGSKPVKVCRLIVSEGSKGSPRQHTFVVMFDKDADPSDQIHDYSTKSLMEDRIEMLEKSREAAARSKAATASAGDDSPPEKAEKSEKSGKSGGKSAKNNKADEAPAKADRSELVASKNTAAEPAASKSGGSAAQGEEGNTSSGSSAEELAVQDIPVDQLKARVEQKINAFYKTCRFLCDKTDVAGTITYGMKLFDNDEEKLVSAVNSKTNARSAKKIRQYFVHLSQLSYKKVDMTASDIKFVSNFHKGPDQKMHASAVIIQDFKGYNDYNILAYKDQTTKVVDIIITTFSEERDGKTVIKFDIFLGNISVTNTPS